MGIFHYFGHFINPTVNQLIEKINATEDEQTSIYETKCSKWAKVKANIV